MNISRLRVCLDKIADFIPGLSSITNGVDICQKNYFEAHPLPASSKKDEYREYLKGKTITTCCRRTIPLYNIFDSVRSIFNTSEGVSVKLELSKENKELIAAIKLKEDIKLKEGIKLKEDLSEPTSNELEAVKLFINVVKSEYDRQGLQKTLDSMYKRGTARNLEVQSFI